MARTVATIQSQITASYVSNMASIGYTIDPTKWSRRNVQQMIIFVIATAINFLEQLTDLFTLNLETQISQSAPCNAAWIQAKMFQFQYDATTPQVLQLDTTNIVYYYPTVDVTKQIIKRCSVTNGIFNAVNIKVATGTPSALSSAQLNAAQAYINLIADAGINYKVISNNPDQLMVGANVWYNGAYATNILSIITAAINAYLAAIPFNGILKLSDLEGAIRNATGVNDIEFANVQARADATAYSSGTPLVTANTVIQPIWQTQAGYVITETTTGHTLADSLNLIPQ